MKVLVCGGRDYADFRKLSATLYALHSEEPITLIIHGAARGADSLAGMWAVQNKVPMKTFPANWKKHGRSAGPIRNREMLTAAQPDLIVAFPGGRGTADMVEFSRSKCFRVKVVD